jgi:antitoxin component of MazEF toxin-antitoxin module
VRQDWVRWGMRLAMTVPTAVARSLEMTDPETVHLHIVGSFKVDEVDALLQQRGRRWADLPADLKKLLLTPILAGLYADLPHKSIQTAPSSEYEIFERCWDRIRHDRQQS